MSQDHVLSVKNVSKNFGSLQAVSNLSFNVNRGEIFGLLGPNGAGKTTTIKMILGMLKPSDGDISVFGLNPRKNEQEVKKFFGYIAEEPIIFKSLTARELFNFIASVRQLDGEKVSKKLGEYLESLGALDYYNKPVATLSHGNKQKIQIIAALLHEPALLILDEPFTGLDAKAVKVFREIIKIHTEQGGSVILSTHIMEIASEMCDRIAILNKGNLVGLGTMKELQAQSSANNKSLEDIFLTLTEQDQSVADIVANLRKSSQKQNGNGNLVNQNLP